MMVLLVIVLVVAVVSGMCGVMLAAFLADRQWKGVFESQEELYNKTVLALTDALRNLQKDAKRLACCLAYENFLDGELREINDPALMKVYIKSHEFCEKLYGIGYRDGKNSKCFAKDSILEQIRHRADIVEIEKIIPREFVEEYAFQVYMAGYNVMIEENPGEVAPHKDSEK